jgi:hypothetical protein
MGISGKHGGSLSLYILVYTPLMTVGIQLWFLHVGTHHLEQNESGTRMISTDMLI